MIELGIYGKQNLIGQWFVFFIFFSFYREKDEKVFAYWNNQDVCQIENKNMNNTTISTQENSRTKDEVDAKDFITAASILKTKFQAL